MKLWKREEEEEDLGSFVGPRALPLKTNVWFDSGGGGLAGLTAQADCVRDFCPGISRRVSKEAFNEAKFTLSPAGSR